MYIKVIANCCAFDLLRNYNILKEKCMDEFYNMYTYKHFDPLSIKADTAAELLLLLVVASATAAALLSCCALLRSMH